MSRHLVTNEPLSHTWEGMSERAAFPKHVEGMRWSVLLKVMNYGDEIERH